jgi:hypothetical protein
MKILKILTGLLFLVFMTGTAEGQARKQKDGFELFGSNEIIDISVKFDLTAFLRKNLKGKFLDGLLTLHTGGKDSITKEVWVNTRGVFRLQYCGFPPMELEFKKPFYVYRYAATITKLKLATQCQSSDLYQDYIFKEYLVYRMFNMLSDTSYRVRLVRATYIDTKKARKPVQQYGFFIEPQTALAVRENATVLKNVEITQRNVDQHVMTRVAIFNFMIGNYDWAVPNRHNITIMATKDTNSYQLPIAIPHDFDWTGIVNPLYAIPTESVGIESVKERIYLGVCLSRETFRAELREFLPFKQKMYSVITEFPYLSAQSKKEITDYLDEFFDQVESPSRINQLIDKMMATCKKI